MNKVENIYWGKTCSDVKGSKSNNSQRKNSQPRWIAPLAAGSLSIMVCLTINYRAYSELNKESVQQRVLMEQIESVRNENLELQEDIYKLKSDPKTIKLEARKIGMSGQH